MARSLFEQYFESLPEFLGMKLGLSRINAAAKEAVGRIDARLIHIAGTNGEGSTSFFIAQLPHQQGFSTVLFTSPHISSVTERIQYNLSPVSTEDFDTLFLAARPYVQKYHLSYFETVYLMTLIKCQQADPVYLILETGLGGRYDATNSSITPVKIPVITSLSQDHKAQLGDKITDIIGEKAAIIGKNSPVFVACNPEFVIERLQSLLSPQTQLHIADTNNLDEARKLYSDPYSYNYMNAHAVAEYLTAKKLPYIKLKLPPCRQEIFGRVMLDGAHNASGVLSLLDSFAGDYPDAVIISATKDRDIARLCRLFERKIRNIILTVIPDNERSIDEETLNILPYKSFMKPEDALRYAQEAFSGKILIAGSLYLCAYMRERLVES